MQPWSKYHYYQGCIAGIINGPGFLNSIAGLVPFLFYSILWKAIYWDHSITAALSPRLIKVIAGSINRRSFRHEKTYTAVGEKSINGIIGMRKVRAKGVWENKLLIQSR